MKTKLLKISSVFFILFACVFVRAQVIESVSYTPAKSGNYQTIAAKSLTVFNGDVNVSSDIIGRGEILEIAVANDKNIGFASNAQIRANRDLFLLSSVAQIPTLTVNGDGKFVNSANSTIGFAPVATDISGGTVNFSGVSASLVNDGTLDINTVRMQNPNCTLKWVKLPAYTQSQTPGVNTSISSYWFAYCDYSQCADGEYFYGNACHPCPQGQINVAAAGQTPICGTMNSSLESNITMIGTCSAGWDGTTCLQGGTCSTNSCVYTTDEAIKGSFTCSNQTVMRCNPYDPNNPGSLFIQSMSIRSKYGTLCNDPSKINLYPTVDYEKTDQTGGCGFYRYKYKAAKVASEGLKSNTTKYVPDPSESVTFGNLSTGSILPNIQQMTLSSARQKGIRQSFCGFSGSNATAANSSIDSILDSPYSMSCTGTNLGVNNYPYCSDLLPANYPVIKYFVNQSQRQQEQNNMCVAMKQNNPSLADTFNCISNGPNKKAYKAVRASTCSTTSKPYTKCATTHTCSDSLTLCLTTDTENEHTKTVVKTRPWDTTYYDSEKHVTNYATALSSLIQPRVTDSDTVIYIPQKITNGKILTCTFTAAS